MLYFTPKSDLRTVENLFALEKQYLEKYFEVLVYVEQHGIALMPFHALSKEFQGEYGKHLEQYTSLRANISEDIHPMMRITERYEAFDPTSFFLAATKFPDYALQRPAFFREEDKVCWLDNTNALIGAIKAKKKQDFWHLVNPLYWVYELFHSIFRSVGLVKLLGEHVVKALSSLFTAAVTVASLWIRDWLLSWFKHLAAK